MAGDASALIVAIVGVFGTLSAAVISQQLSARTRRQELDLERLHRNDESDREKQRAALLEKRACYIAMTAASRRYRVELMNYLYAVKRGIVGEGARAELEEARRAYIACMAETHMTATTSVLEALETVTSGLSNSYRAVKQLEDGEAEENWSFEEIREFLIKLWDNWRDMRLAMRHDLGVPD